MQSGQSSDGLSYVPNSVDDSASLLVRLRDCRTVRPFDSVRLAIERERESGIGFVPVVLNEQLLGVFRSTCLPVIGSQSELNDLLMEPVDRHLTEMGFTISSDFTSSQAISELITRQLPAAPVIDSDNNCLGVAVLSDLLSPDVWNLRPYRVGGMATPFGVYLTDGRLRAGAVDWALVVTGMLLGITLTFSTYIVQELAILIQHQSGLPLMSLLNMSVSGKQDGLKILALSLQIISPLLFLLILRAMPLTGFHAAEHMTVHAIEQGEPLDQRIVARMPRIHPRCGTNLMAAGAIFLSVSQTISVLAARALDSGSGAILAAMVTFFAWRPFGAFLQQYFTTKPPTDRQLQSGIAAGQELLDKFNHAPPGRPELPLRVWRMGILQVMAGASLTMPLAWLVLR